MHTIDFADPQRASALADDVLRLARGRCDEAEAGVALEEVALTRFARTAIHQNVVQGTAELSLRVNRDGRIGRAAGNQGGAAGLERLVRRAVEAADRRPPDPDWPGMAAPDESDTAGLDAWSEHTAACPPAERGALIAAAVRQVPERALAFGGLLTAHESRAVATSSGVRLAQRRTWSEARCTVHADSLAGYAARAAADVADVRPGELVSEALAKALTDGEPATLPAGDYPVVLSEYAVLRLLEVLGFLGFAGSAAAEGRSFMRLGERLTGEQVSVRDDGNDPACLPLAFDPEGTRKARVDLLNRGVASGLLYDRRSARQAGCRSTGHAMPAHIGGEPAAANLIMAPGVATEADLLQTERGVLVTRLHYVNVLDRLTLRMTGVTRDGTLLIENGKITRPVRDMRFNVGVLDLLNNVEAIGALPRLLLQTSYGAALVPSMRLASFSFAGGTQPR